MKWLRLC